MYVTNYDETMNLSSKGRATGRGMCFLLGNYGYIFGVKLYEKWGTHALFCSKHSNNLYDFTAIFSARALDKNEH
jgi:hypothetical protein